MRIIHFCLCGPVTDGMRYQENILAKLHREQGNEVLMAATCAGYDETGTVVRFRPGRCRFQDGFDVIRLPERPVFRVGPLRRVRMFQSVRTLLEEFRPEIIFFHGISSCELYTIARWCGEHPSVTLWIDNHADRNNSATNALSLHVQHRLMYRRALHAALPYAKKVLCISLECMDFAREVYGVPEEKLEFYPLGGELLPAQELRKRRAACRTAEGAGEDEVIFLHTGKMGALKKTTDVIRAFRSVKAPHARLWIAGVLMDEIRDEALALMEGDDRIRFLGWKSGEELGAYLCAADVYVQPGTQSATMQRAMCCGCAMLLYPHRSHEPYLDGNGFFVQSEADLLHTMETLSTEPETRYAMQKKSIEIARKLLDYEQLAARVLK